MKASDTSIVEQNTNMYFLEEPKSNTMKNKKTIFITNTTSKVFEHVYMRLMEEKVNFSEYQSGGRKQQSTTDQTFIVKTVLDNQKNCQENTYMLFGDPEKYFDKLWLQDCITDNDTGILEKDEIMVYHLNKEALVNIATSVGKTDNIHLEDESNREKKEV